MFESHVSIKRTGDRSASMPEITLSDLSADDVTDSDRDTRQRSRLVRLVMLNN